LVLCPITHTDDRISQVQTRKLKNKAATAPVLIYGTDAINFTDTNCCDGREHYARYHLIYHIFQNEEYHSDDEYINEYRNIGKRGIHIVIAHPMLFPYNDVARWSFTQLQKETATIVNTSKVLITYLKGEDTKIM